MKCIQRQHRKRTGIVVSLLLLATAYGSVSCSPGGNSESSESITLGTVLLEPSTLIFIAEAQGLFTQNDLDVTLEYYETGLSAANAMLAGESDIAGPVTEYVLVGKVFNAEEIQTFGSIDKVDYASIVARKDRGIEVPGDLFGKKIGVPRGTILEFRLGRFLELQGIGTEDIELVDITLAKSVEAITGGDIDAYVAVPPYIDALQIALGDNALLLPAQGGQLSYQLLVGKTGWISQHPGLIERFVSALSQAQEYLIENPDEAKAILQKKLNLTDADIVRIWSQNQFSLSLDQSLIIAMEDEARWMISKDLTNEGQIPNFIDSIFFDPLEAVKPEAINIIR